MIGFRKKSPPAIAAPSQPWMAMNSVAALAAPRALATSEFIGDVALAEQCARRDALYPYLSVAKVGESFAAAACYAEMNGRLWPEAHFR